MLVCSVRKLRGRELSFFLVHLKALFICVMQVSKNAGRFRFQSGTLEALYLVAHDLLRRLAAFFEVTDSGDRGQDAFTGQ